MKFLVLVVVCVCISKTAALSVENKIKNQQHKFINAIPLPQKAEPYYHTTGQGQEYVQVPIIPKPMYVSAQPTMLIIAQPAYVHPNVYYGGGASHGMQQLLNYFHNNPQAKYQLLYGGYQHQQQQQAVQAPQTYVQHQPASSQPVATYQIVPTPVFNPYNQLVAAHSHVNYNQLPYHTNHIGNPISNHIGNPISNHIGNHFVQPLHHISQLSHLAQMAAHHQYPVPIRSIPPVITGLENFTPEQQAQIKAHLGAHLGTHLGTQVNTATYAPTSSTIPPTASQPQQQTQYTTQPAQTAEKNYPTSSTFTPSVLYRSQYTKGK